VFDGVLVWINPLKDFPVWGNLLVKSPWCAVLPVNICQIFFNHKNVSSSILLMQRGNDGFVTGWICHSWICFVRRSLHWTAVDWHSQLRGFWQSGRASKTMKSLQTITVVSYQFWCRPLTTVVCAVCLNDAIILIFQQQTTIAGSFSVSDLLTDVMTANKCCTPIGYRCVRPNCVTDFQLLLQGHSWPMRPASSLTTTGATYEIITNPMCSSVTLRISVYLDWSRFLFECLPGRIIGTTREKLIWLGRWKNAADMIMV